MKTGFLLLISFLLPLQIFSQAQDVSIYNKSENTTFINNSPLKHSLLDKNLNSNNPPLPHWDFEKNKKKEKSELLKFIEGVEDLLVLIRKIPINIVYKEEIKILGVKYFSKNSLFGAEYQVAPIKNFRVYMVINF